MPTYATYKGWADVREVSAATVSDLVEGHTMRRFPKNERVEVSPELAKALQDERFGSDFEIEELDAEEAEDANEEDSAANKDSNPDGEVDPVTPSTGDAVSEPPTGSTRTTSRASSSRSRSN